MAIKYLNNIDLRTNELQYAVIQPSINPPIDITSKLGQVYFNTTDDKLKIYTSAGWVTVGGVSSITSGDINTITIGGTIFNPTVSANTAPVTNGSLNLVTGNDVYNFVDGFGYIPYIGANQNVDLGVYSLTADSIIKVGGTSSEFLMADGSTSIAVPFNPSDYDLDEFTNLNVDPFAKISDLPTYSDFIQDSITNGVVTKAPTENAVYDALQLKQNNLGYTPVNKAGDTMLGNLILNQDPSNALQAATKQYVDNVVTGINFHPPVTVATDVSLVATYDNGLAGVGATLTGPSVGVLSIDGEFPAYLDRILVWQQTNPIENGIYDLTTVGDNVTVYQLTRSTDADNNPAGEIHYGDYVLVLSGDTNGGFGFICNTPGTIDIGITPINYVQFNAAQAVTAGYGLQEIISNIIEIDPLVTQEKITLTTIGSGAATLVSNTLNIPTIGVVSATETGVVNNTSLQELGGVDKTINGIRIGRGNISSINSANTAVGYQVLKSVINTTGLEGYYNTAVGHSALTALTTGNQNDAFGSYALYSCTTGLYNAALGTAALLSLTNGSNNVAIGASALRINLNGVRNVAIGSSALRNSTGSDNTAVGHFAGGSATSSGSSNILIGFQAGRDVSTGTNNLLIENITNASITSGSYNIVLNPKQKSGVTTGSYNTIIGCWDGAFADGLTSNVIIGDGLGQIRFQSTDTGLTTVPGQTNVLIDADTTGKAVVTKEYLTNVTGSQNLQQVTNLGATTTNSITANSFIKNGGSPTEYLMADGSTTNELGYTPVNKAGDTMTGSLILNANPTVAFGAATKSYVDTLINGIDWKAAANAATTTSLPTYTVSGSGQILIGTVTIPVIDGVTLTATQRLLVKNETSTLAPNNGIYVVTQVNPFILTRSSDANTPSLLAEATISVSGGSTLANTQWHCNPASVPIVIGTTNIAFAGIGANAYTFNSPLINTSNVISVLNASGTQSGVVTIGAQTFAGAKTFTDNLTAGRYLYSGGSIFPEFGQTFYINGSGAAHIFGGGTSGVQNDLQLPNGTLIVGSGVVGTPFGGFTSSSILGKSGGGVLDLRNSNSSILSGDSSGTIQFSFKGISTVGYTTATIRTIFSTAPTAGNGGNSYMVFSTNDGANGGTPAEKMRLDNNGLLLTNETASTIASFDVNKNVKSLTTANGYPTLTELKSLVGVSATTIQTQLNGKQSLATNLTSLSGLTYASPSFVKMTGVNTFTLDTSTYLTSVGIANLTATGTPSSTTYLRGDNTWATVGGTITLSAIGTVPNANGATITGSVLNLQPADAANGGVITTGVQTFGGAKTFANNITASASIIATTAPTTSLGSYNILTRNTSTGVFEKLEATNIQPLVYNILIESNSGITTQTLGINNGAEYSQDGRNVMIKNDTTAIIVTATNASDSFIASYTKLSTNNITFATSGTLIAPYGAVLYGNPGSTALLTKNGTTVYLLVNNLL